ncbi:glucosyl-dolichyl phosphate glucuronosyltransferase [Methylomarinovum caldicuralii]|uniref:Glucosyl-dolichyl phosphate glucuronosyltransferase n=1 Tax=Methylomarinovum caldicuralii TaxID=438856 RepID=A0AAU9C0E8_9GAMM|nr:glycosyltransferase family 2 protein [Methylomarinovum caldicuralii]BCX82135.1 glucosyl-dolichyl phosphate glucuronosyltransferase [Methylomarinovum caldicuralii]
MDLSVIICTYNRCHNLAECFRHLEAQQLDGGLDWEVLLVDNNSTDATRDFVQDFARNTPLNLHYTFCGEQGLSHARNHGIAEARGRRLVFIDDDIQVTPGWLQAIHDTFEEHDCDAVGGRIHLEISLEQLPKWIRPDMYGFLGYQDFGDRPYRLDGFREFPFGGNMAIHRRVFDKIGLFDTGMGRKGAGTRKAELFKGEETDFFHRLAENGGVIWYQPSALVHHKVLPHQLRRRFFLTLHHNAGILKACRDPTSYPNTIAGVPRFLYLQLLRAIWRYLGLAVGQGPDYAFRQLMNVAYFLGMIQGYYRRKTP